MGMWYSSDTLFIARYWKQSRTRSLFSSVESMNLCLFLLRLQLSNNLEAEKWKMLKKIKQKLVKHQLSSPLIWAEGEKYQIKHFFKDPKFYFNFWLSNMYQDDDSNSCVPGLSPLAPQWDNVMTQREQQRISSFWPLLMTFRRNTGLIALVKW